MEPQQSTPSNKNNMVLPVVVAALVVFAIIGFYLYQSSNKTAAPSGSLTPKASTTTQNAPTTTTVTNGEYKDGEYTATGNYVSPGGPREVTVSITIADGKISDSTFVGGADDPTSKRFQGEFSGGYKALIVGKNVDEVTLTKVAGSSLTPKGFNDALSKIKTEAKS